MECPKTQCALNKSTKCGNDTYEHKHYSPLPNSEKTMAKFFSDVEMINVTPGTLYYKQISCIVHVLNMFAF